MCLNPSYIKNRKYIPNKKNGGIIPPILDNRVLMVPVGCGVCIECKKQKSRSWQIRLKEDIKRYKNPVFVTLTFSEQSLKSLRDDCKIIYGKNWIDDDNIICTLAVRRFLERYRKKYKKSIRHWLISEKGHEGTKRIHLHGILYIENKEEIEKFWKYGWVYLGDYVNNKTINYIIKYVTKVDTVNKGFEGKIFCTAGIGRGWEKTLNAENSKYKGKDTKETYINEKGFEMGLPIYYRNKIYTEDEREKLWLNRLDKHERWVLGQKIDISNGLDEYENALHFARILNNSMGYLNEKDFSSKKYLKQVKELNNINNDYILIKTPELLVNLDEMRHSVYFTFRSAIPACER